MMEINTNKPVGDPVRGPEKAQPVDRAKREKQEASGQPSSQVEESPDYRIRLSDASRQAVAELAGERSAGQSEKENDLSDDEATRISQQASDQLAQTNASISNDAIQKAVDLFT